MDDYFPEGFVTMTTVYDSPEDKTIPVFTGLLRSDGSPINRYPVRYRMGFHPPEKQMTYSNDMDFDVDDIDNGVIGWVYDG